MRYLALLILFWLPAAAAPAGGVSLTPQAIDNGGVALLRWEGETPSVALARLHDRVFFLAPRPGGAEALVGADVELPPGDYPLVVGIVDHRGNATTHHLQLTVRHRQRPAERLTLPEEMVTPREPATLERIEAENRLLREIYARETPRLWEGFLRPVSDPVGSIFGLRRILNGKPRSPHSGVDFRSPSGRPVLAAARGEVVYAGDLYYTGLTVLLDHGGGLFTLYAHLETLLCRTGEVLEPGTPLGRVGSTGRSTGPHLHWGAKLHGDRVDPLALLALAPGQGP